jgi:hypothetical protein
MKNRLSEILFITGLIIILSVAGIVFSGCSTPTGASFALEAPGCTATWNPAHTYVAWSKVDGADYYIIYARQFTLGTIPPKDPKTFTEIYRTAGNTQSSYDHVTPDDFCYAVKAFGNNGESSDYSNVAFTW